MVNKGYTKKEALDVLFESERERKLRRMQAIVIETVAPHRIKKIRDFLAYQELATWRRMNGFDRVADGDGNWFHGHRSLPSTPEEYAASLWSEVNAFKEAISMPAEDTVTRSRQKDSLDELLANFEFARIEEYVEKRSREAAKAQVTAVTRDDTVQHYCSPCSPNPEPSPDACGNLENKGKMDPKLEELKSPSAGTGLEMPGQQCPPYEGIWEQGRTIANNILTAGVDSSQKEHISSPTTKAWTNERKARQRLQASLRQLQPRKTADSRHSANKTSSSTPVGGERRHRLGMRL